MRWLLILLILPCAQAGTAAGYFAESGTAAWFELTADAATIDYAPGWTTLQDETLVHRTSPLAYQQDWARLNFAGKHRVAHEQWVGVFPVEYGRLDAHGPDLTTATNRSVYVDQARMRPEGWAVDVEGTCEGRAGQVQEYRGDFRISLWGWDLNWTGVRDGALDSGVARTGSWGAAWEAGLPGPYESQQVFLILHDAVLKVHGGVWTTERLFSPCASIPASAPEPESIVEVVQEPPANGVTEASAPVPESKPQVVVVSDAGSAATWIMASAFLALVVLVAASFVFVAGERTLRARAKAAGDRGHLGWQAFWLRRLRRLDASRAQVHVALADVAVKRRRYGQAVRLYQEAWHVASSSERPTIAFEAARCAALAGRGESAARLLISALKARPDLALKAESCAEFGLVSGKPRFQAALRGYLGTTEA